MLNNSVKNEKNNLVQETVLESGCKNILIEAIKSKNPALLNYCSGSRVLKAKNNNSLSSSSYNQVRAYTPAQF